MQKYTSLNLICFAAMLTSCTWGPHDSKEEGCIPEEKFVLDTASIRYESHGTWAGYDLNTCYKLGREQAGKYTLRDAMKADGCATTELEDAHTCDAAIAMYRDPARGQDILAWGNADPSHYVVFQPSRPGGDFFLLDAEQKYPRIAGQDTRGWSSINTGQCPGTGFTPQACDPDQIRTFPFTWWGVDPSEWELVEVYRFSEFFYDSW